MKLTLNSKNGTKEKVIQIPNYDLDEHIKDEIKMFCKKNRIIHCKFKLEGASEVRDNRLNQLTALFG